MKDSIILFVTLLISSFTASGTVVICESAQQINCDRITKVKLATNQPWINACCEHFDLPDGHTCEDDCMPTFTNTTNDVSKSQALDYVSYEILEGLKWTDKSTNTKHSLEFIGNVVYKDGKKLFEVREGISAIIMEIPNSNGLYIKLGLGDEPKVKTDPNKYFDATAKALEDEFSAIDEIRVYPNPINPRIPLNLSSPASIDKVYIYDMNGKVVYKDDNDWKGSCEVNINNFQDGIYLVRFITSKGPIMITRKIIINSDKGGSKQ